MRSIDSYKNRHGKIWLNVASSVDVLVDFINLDNSIFLQYLGIATLFKNTLLKKHNTTIINYQKASTKASLIRHDCRKPLFFPDNSVDHILCSHFLEHVYAVEAEAILHDFYRVLKPGATLHVIVPDLNILVDRFVSRSQGADPLAADDFIDSTLMAKKAKPSLIFRLLQLRGSFGLQHLWMYDRLSMAERMRNCGFEILDYNETPSGRFRLDDGVSLHMVGVK